MGKKKKSVQYISFEEFVRNSGMKKRTVLKRYKDIPGFTKKNDGFLILSGTRYPCDLHRYGLKNSGEKRFALLKAISEYRYVSHVDLKVEQRQFQDMLRDLLSAGVIQPNNLDNPYGANAYDCSTLGDELLKQEINKARETLVKLVAQAAGTYTGAVISQVCEAA